MMDDASPDAGDETLMILHGLLVFEWGTLEPVDGEIF
jgi:hypothetical protein